MKKKQALEIAKTYPKNIKIIPREDFDNQLADFIMKIEESIKSTGKNS